MSAPRLVAGLLAVVLLAACGEDDPLEAQAQRYLDALMSDASCDAVWELAVSDGEEQSEFCDALAEYRTEVRDLTLGAMTESTADYAIFAVRVDFRDGSPPVLDSEVEVDVVDGEPLVAAGLP